MLSKIIQFFLSNRLVSILLFILITIWGLSLAPFDWNLPFFSEEKVFVDAIPDIGENQQIVFTEWPGRSPQDVEDQITYPLTTYLMGIPGVKSVRSNSLFGFSSIYVIFNDDVEFYWSRSRILEKINSIPESLIPNETRPTLGPDATALGQVFWYTLEGRDSKGNVSGGWDLHELRSIQDYYVKNQLNSVQGVSEVASIGGYIKEYHIDINPITLKNYSISLDKVVQAVNNSNKDTGAKTIEINQVEYFVRGLGYIKTLEDIENIVVDHRDGHSITVKDIAVVKFGPAERRGILDKNGVESVGGVVVSRYGANPMEVTKRIKSKIEEIGLGLPEKELQDGRISKVTIVPFYDRSTLIKETLFTLEKALTLEILITVLVVIVMVQSIRTSIAISGILPLAILMVFIGMKLLGITANIMALSGIAIAIGTMVDLGVILSENTLKHLSANRNRKNILTIIKESSIEIAPAIITAVSTTIISFIPVFMLESAEGKLFGPLAYTKTLALIASLIITLFLLPAILFLFFKNKNNTEKMPFPWFAGLLFIIAIFSMFISNETTGIFLLFYSSVKLIKYTIIRGKIPFRYVDSFLYTNAEIIVVILFIGILFSAYWLPFGPGVSLLLNTVFVFILLFMILGLFKLIENYYAPVLGYFLKHKLLFFTVPIISMFLSLIIWFGFKELTGIDNDSAVGKKLSSLFPGLSSEFMPSLDEGSYLLMPTSMPHSGVEFNRRALSYMDKAVNSIPEVEAVLGKAGRVDSPLDPAPLSMFENIINYKSEYASDISGRRFKFKTDEEGYFIDVSGNKFSNEEIIIENIDISTLQKDEDGKYLRQWRQQIKSKQDIWDEIVKASAYPGVTSAPKLQPIETRIIMLQTGMRAPMGIKIFGSDLTSIEKFGQNLETLLKENREIKSSSVYADRIIAKPYLLLEIDREALKDYGLTVSDVQNTITNAIGGMTNTFTVEGRERYAVRIRYPRELRSDPHDLRNIYISIPGGAQIPLQQVVNIKYENGPQSIKSEDTFLTAYVLFDKARGYTEEDAVNSALWKIKSSLKEGILKVPPGVSYRIAGEYENRIRAEKRFQLILPVVLVLIFIILYLRFRSGAVSLMVFTGIALAFSGGFILLWFYNQTWFMNFEIMDFNMADLLQVSPVNLSVAVWVGFIALFGIATDDGVLMATYIKSKITSKVISNKQELHELIVQGGKKRVRAALMTSATTLIALLPVLTSTGKGSNVMLPMAIPIFGGMVFSLITIFFLPVLYSIYEEIKLTKKLQAK